MTKVLALNGSPRGLESNTQALLTPFLEGAREAGAETDLLVVRDLDVKFCRGCFACWSSTPGRCCQKDDMTRVLDLWRQSDYVVYGTPLYHFGMTAVLKRVIERTLPVLEPRMEQYGDRTGHPLRQGSRRSRAVLIANCGFPERVHFDPLVEQMRHLTGGGKGLAATILVAGGQALNRTYSPDSPFSWLFAAVRQAGREVVTQGRLSPATQETLDHPLAPAEVYRQVANASWVIKDSAGGRPKPESLP